MNDYLKVWSIKDYSNKIKKNDEVDIIPLKRVCHPSKNPFLDPNKSIKENKEILKKHNEKVIGIKKYNQQFLKDIKTQFKHGLLDEIVQYTKGFISLKQAELIYERSKINPFNIIEKKQILIDEINYVTNILTLEMLRR